MYFAEFPLWDESAKILNPEKTVLMPDMAADCPMAHMASPETIEKVRAEYDDLAVVCYINSTAELKRHSDVCVTSANAVKIVKNLPNKNIFFIPDRNLAHYIAGLVPEKHFIYNEGFCIVHEYMEVEEIQDAKKAHPDAEVLAHPGMSAGSSGTGRLYRKYNRNHQLCGRDGCTGDDHLYGEWCPV